jgi:hypothetical protein
MGFPLLAYELLKIQKESIKGSSNSINKKCLMFGRAKMTLTDQQIKKVIARDNISPDLLKGWADNFLNTYGFDWVRSLDYSSFEGAEFTWNLNKPLVNPCGAITEIIGNIDLILDYGTTEHVFNPSLSIWNASVLLRKGGYFNSILPVLGFCDHGFYQFSPSFFYSVDRPELKLEALYFSIHDRHADSLIFWDGLSSEFREHVHGAFDGSFAANCLQFLNKPIVAWALYKKENDVTHDDFVYDTQQSIYSAQWEGALKKDLSDADKLEIYLLSGDERARKLGDYVRSIALPQI